MTVRVDGRASDQRRWARSLRPSATVGGASRGAHLTPAATPLPLSPGVRFPLSRTGSTLSPQSRLLLADGWRADGTAIDAFRILVLTVYQTVRWARGHTGHKKVFSPGAVGGRVVARACFYWRLSRTDGIRAPCMICPTTVSGSCMRSRYGLQWPALSFSRLTPTRARGTSCEELPAPDRSWRPYW
jgi:hypothetical protein